MEKRKTKTWSTILFLAILVTGILIPNNMTRAQAETQGTYRGYATYADYYEHICLLHDCEMQESNLTYNGVLCTSVLMSDELPVLGYTSDGAKIIIYDAQGYDYCEFDKDGYDTDGYDFFGYDRSGYNEEGYDRDGYNRDGIKENGTHRDAILESVVFENQNEGTNTIVWSPKDQIQVSKVKDNYGMSISDTHYTISTKKVSVNKNDYGTYKVTVKGDKFYNDSKITKTLKVVPGNEVTIMADIRTSRRDRPKYSELSAFRLISKYDQKEWKTAYKNIEGYEIVVAKDKTFKKIYTGRHQVLQTKDGFKFHNYTEKKIIKKAKFKKTEANLNNKLTYAYYDVTDFAKIQGKSFYYKYRTYVIVNGKKIYSAWQVYKQKTKFNYI